MPVDGADCPSQIESQSVTPAVPVHTRQRRGATRGRQGSAGSEKPENCRQKKQTKQMDGAVQPSGGATLGIIVQDKY